MNPSINFGCPLNKDETLSITPGVSMLKEKNKKRKEKRKRCKDNVSIFVRNLTVYSSYYS